MRWYFGTSLAVTSIALGLAACGGSGGSPRAIATSASGAAAPVSSVRATVIVPAHGKSAAKRGRAYVSPSTMGLIVTVHDTNGTASYGYEIAATAPGCSAIANGETECNLTLPAAIGNDTFDAYTYDQSEGTANPTTLGASFVASGNLLSEVKGVASTIVADTSNVITLTLKADTKTVSLSPTVLSVSGNGGTTNAFAEQNYDADVNPIPEQSTSAGYDNLVTPTLTDSGNHTTYGSNGDTFVFDGSSSPQPVSPTASPYAAKLTVTTSLSDAGYNGTTSYPTASASLTIAPLFLYASSYSMQSGSSTTLYAIAAATPPGAAYAITKTADTTTNNCDPFTIASAAPSPAPPQVATFGVSATASSPTTNGTPVPCVFAVSDGTGTSTHSQPFYANGTTVVIVVPSAVPSPSPSPTVTPGAPSPIVGATATPSPSPSPAAT